MHIQTALHKRHTAVCVYVFVHLPHKRDGRGELILVSIRQHTSAYVSIRQHTCYGSECFIALMVAGMGGRETGRS